jgi:hypothetical protein
MQCIAVSIALFGDHGVPRAKVRLWRMRTIAAREAECMSLKSWLVMILACDHSRHLCAIYTGTHTYCSSHIMWRPWVVRNDIPPFLTCMSSDVVCASAYRGLDNRATSLRAKPRTSPPSAANFYHTLERSNLLPAASKNVVRSSVIFRTWLEGS